MNKTTTGWVMFIAALGMFFSMEGIDLASVHGWHEVFSPEFTGTMIGHLGAIIAAFIGGKLIPESRDNVKTRSTD